MPQGAGLCTKRFVGIAFPGPPNAKNAGRPDAGACVSSAAKSEFYVRIAIRNRFLTVG